MYMRVCIYLCMYIFLFFYVSNCLAGQPRHRAWVYTSKQDAFPPKFAGGGSLWRLSELVSRKGGGRCGDSGGWSPERGGDCGDSGGWSPEWGGGPTWFAPFNHPLKNNFLHFSICAWRVPKIAQTLPLGPRLLPPLRRDSLLSRWGRG